ncbi:MAG: Asp-tRNA(Asn)/Glu-tRNA(Gln) amidotransferase subunit GatA [Bacteroidetes bacterium]|nr:Asp-tRNA(Asn)/Glu-tRNA(Gln) amidotransferase subunit GatA [Bacteroidota bacterium]
MQTRTYQADRKRYLEGTTTVSSVVSAFLAEIEASNERLNILVEVYASDALMAARNADQRIARGDARPLEGCVITLKDLLSRRGDAMTAASEILQGYRASITATAVERLCDAGAIVIGRANCDAFGMGSSTEHSMYGPTRNPRDESCVAGGSSGGSAASVAAGYAHASLGRIKPTYGRVSRYGLTAYASSLDVIGPLGNHPEDLNVLLSTMMGADRRDATSITMDPVTVNRRVLGTLAGELVEQLPPSVRDALGAVERRFEEEGYRVQPIDLPTLDAGIAAYYVIATAEASSNLGRFDGIRYGKRVDADDIASVYTRSRSQGFGDEVKRRIMLGTYVLSSGYYDAYYDQAMRVRAKLTAELQEALQHVDALLMPTAPSAAFKLGEKVDDPLALYLGDVFTVLANLAGVPAISFPAGSDGGRPLGMQLVGTRGQDEQLIHLAATVAPQDFYNDGVRQ